MEPLKIKDPQGDYIVRFVDVVAIRRIPHGSVLCDTRVNEPYFRCPSWFQIGVSEPLKNLERVSSICDWLADRNHDKTTPLIVIGGGYTQDLGCFVAHVYKRGIPWVYIPTTLLSMADSCIGSKAGLNLSGWKQQIGCYHPPSEVIICPEFLESLSALDTASGLGEVMKLGVIGGWKGEPWESLLSSSGKLTAQQILQVIRASLETKKAIIEEDPYDRGKRLILNYGHTFGHALESVTDYAIPHGIAVIWGMDLINAFASDCGDLSRRGESAIRTAFSYVLQKRPLDMKIKVSFAALMKAVAQDKKVRGTHVNLAIAYGVGDVRMKEVPIYGDLEKSARDYCMTKNILADVLTFTP